jgi:hypothetical protein
MRLPSALLLFVSILPASGAYAVECNINQATLATRQIDLLRRHPGGRLDKQGHLITWRQGDGGFVTVQHAGCMDLVTEIRVVYSSGKAASEQAAIATLIAAVRMYWPSPHADAIVEQMAGASLVRKDTGPGAVEFTSTNPEASPYRLTLSARSASVSWLDG